MQKYIYTNRSNETYLDKLQSKNKWLFDTNFEKALEEVKFESKINDDGDFVVKIKNSKCTSKYAEPHVISEYTTIYYYESTNHHSDSQ